MPGRTLVTGATGFLGRNLVSKLALDGADVTVLQRQGASSGPIVKGLAAQGAQIVDYGTQEEFREKVVASKFDRVFHLATLYTREHLPSDIGPLIEANIGLGTQLLDAVVGTECVVVSALSFFQFRHELPAPYSLYSATKEAFTTVARHYRDVALVDVREVVLYDTFGPGDTRPKLIPHVARSFANGTPLSLGPSTQLVNLLFVADVIAGLIAVADGDHSDRVALRAAENVTVLDLVSTFTAVTGRTVEVDFDQLKPVNDLVTESGDWPAPTGWSSQTSLNDGVSAVWQSLC